MLAKASLAPPSLGAGYAGHPREKELIIMVLTLELPIRLASHDPFAVYETRFGALPDWIDELSFAEALALVRQALRAGTPLTSADHFH